MTVTDPRPPAPASGAGAPAIRAITTLLKVPPGMIRVFGHDVSRDRMAGTYSGGMVRRLELAQALVSAPRLLILDGQAVLARQ